MLLALIATLLAVAPEVPEGDAQAYTSLLDAKSGAVLADGRYAQWIKDDVLHIESRFDFPDGRSVVERAAVRLHPRLVQESWDWTERKGSNLVREYVVNFKTQHAVATRVDQNKRWKEDLDIEPGKTFAGIAFVAVIKVLRAHLEPGQKMDLKAVAFTPKPRVAPVNVIRRGADKVSMAGRSLAADHYTVHPDIPGVVKLFVNAPDQEVWLFGGGPPAFLSFQGPLVEPDDQVIRVDLIPSASPRVEGRRGPPPKR